MYNGGKLIISVRYYREENKPSMLSTSTEEVTAKKRKIIMLSSFINRFLEGLVE